MAEGDAGRTSILVFALQITARVVGFLGLVYFARVLPQEELGVYFLFYLVVQIASLVSGLGLGTAVVQRVSSSDRPDAMYSAAMTLIVTVTVIAGAAFVLLQEPIGDYVGANVPLLLTLGVAGWLLADLHKRAIQGEDRVLVSNGLQLIEDIGRVGLGAVLITLGFGAEGIMIGLVGGFALTTLVGVALTNLRFTRPARRDFTSLFEMSRYTMFYGPTNFIYFWFDTFMIGLWLGQASVSAYEVAWQTTRVLIVPTNAISQTIFPKVSRWETEDARETIEDILPGVVLFTLTIPLPGLVGLLVLGPELLSLVYQPEYAEAAIPLVILGGYMVIEALHRVGNTIVTGMDRPEIPFRSRMVGVVLAIGLNVLLIPRYELVGAAVATFAAKLADALLLWIPIARLLDVDLPWRSLVWQVLASVLMGLALYWVTTQQTVSSLPVLLTMIAAGATTYWLLILLDAEIRRVLLQYVPVGPW